MALSWATPALLWGLCLLPGLIWWLRRWPPLPLRVAFPAMRLVLALPASPAPKQRTPWPMLLRRAGIIALAVLGFAGPSRHMTPVRSGPLLLIVDNGWASAPSWDSMRAAAMGEIEASGAASLEIYVLATADDRHGQAAHLIGPMDRAAARRHLEQMAPHPWPVSRGRAAMALAQATLPRGLTAIWLSDGQAESGDDALRRALDALGAWTAYAPEQAALLLRPPQPTAQGASWRVARAHGDTVDRTVTLRAVGADGTEWARQSMVLGTSQRQGGDVMPISPPMRAKVARWEIWNHAGAGGVVLADPSSGRGEIVVRDAPSQEQPLTRASTYVRRALAPDYAVQDRWDPDDASDALDRADERPVPPAMVIMPSGGTPSGAELQKWRDYIQGGGWLVRMAGVSRFDPLDPLLPAPLSDMPHQTEGTLGWGDAPAIEPPGADSPLFGLSVSPDIKISWVLRPLPTLPSETQVWARLTDGTPLVLAQRIGQGWLVFITTRADDRGGAFVLSGSFVSLMRLLASKAHAPRAFGAMPAGAGRALADKTALPAYQVLDGWGHLGPPDAAVLALASGQEWQPSPAHPPGIYGSGGRMQTMNLGQVLPDPQPLPWAQAFPQPSSRATAQPLGGLLLVMAIALLIGDMILLARRAPRRLAAQAAILAGLAAAFAGTGQASASSLDFTQADLVLAYVMTGDAATDRQSAQGLRGLALVLEQRTSLAHVAVTPVLLDQDDLALYPLIYWPVTDSQTRLSPEAARRWDSYGQQGGMTLFDLRGRDGALLAQLLEGLTIPPLDPLPDDHVLRRSFYLLNDMPGRRADAALWVSPGVDRQDGLGEMVVGDGDWAAAWAGYPAADSLPGGQAQRESAYRFGVNLVMMALTGQYKNDQIHLPHILRRLQRGVAP